MPRLSSPRAYRPMRSTLCGMALAMPSAKPFWRAIDSSFVSAASIASGFWSASITTSARVDRRADAGADHERERLRRRTVVDDRRRRAKPVRA